MTGTTWPTVLRWTALAAVVESVLAMGVVERAVIPPVIVIAVGLLVGAVLLRSTPRAGVRTTTVAAIAFLLSNLIFAGPNLVVAASFATFAVTWASVVTGALGTIAGVASWRGRERGPAVPRVATAGVALVAVAVVVGLVASLGYSNAKPAPGDVIVRAKDSKFPATLTASSGRVSFFLDNTDNTLHDFHLLTVKTKTMPADHKTRVSVTLKPGTYKYRCDFHDDMKGTLTVS